MHTVQRHKEILIDHKQEFKRTRQNVTSAQSRAQLFFSVQQDNKANNGNNSLTNQLNARLARIGGDKDHLASADKMTTNVIRYCILLVCS